LSFPSEILLSQNGGPIQGLQFEPRRVIADDRGAVIHHLRGDSPLLPSFGEVYASTIHQGAIKAWKKHLRVAQNLSVPIGAVRVVVHDNRPDSTSSDSTMEFVLNRQNHGILHIPAGLWYGFQGMGAGESLTLNCVSDIHDPAESVRLPEDSGEIPYHWSNLPPI